MPISFKIGKGKKVRITEDDIALNNKNLADAKKKALSYWDAQIQNKYPKTDPDDHVDYRFNRSWRTSTLTGKETIGVYYGYWNMVVNDIFKEFNRHRSILIDPIADAIAKEPGYSRQILRARDVMGVWQGTGGKSRQLVTKSTVLEGPLVDVGLRPDFALFLENWVAGNLPNIPVLQNIGVIHLIARKMHAKWLGVHTIMAMSVKPPEGGDSILIRGRKKAIELFPVIRITSRHYSVRRGGRIA